MERCRIFAVCEAGGDGVAIHSKCGMLFSLLHKDLLFNSRQQGKAMCGRLYPAGLNIDYYPTNFVPCGGTLYYIDYECNAYMQEWDFAHWGARYWTIQAPEKPDEA